MLKENLAVSPQCGFGTSIDAAGKGMTIDGQWKKMELLQRLAEEIWPGGKEQSGATQ